MQSSPPASTKLQVQWGSWQCNIDPVALAVVVLAGTSAAIISGRLWVVVVLAVASAVLWKAWLEKHRLWPVSSHTDPDNCAESGCERTREIAGDQKAQHEPVDGQDERDDAARVPAPETAQSADTCEVKPGVEEEENVVAEPDHMELKLERADGEDWGFAWQVSAHKARRLIIAGISISSPAGTWNAQQEGSLTMQVGDELLSIDGATGSQALQSILASASAVQLRFLRAHAVPQVTTSLLALARPRLIRIDSGEALASQDNVSKAVRKDAVFDVPNKDAFVPTVKNTFIQLSLPNVELMDKFAQSDPGPMMMQMRALQRDATWSNPHAPPSPTDHQGKIEEASTDKPVQPHVFELDETSPSEDQEVASFGTTWPSSPGSSQLLLRKLRIASSDSAELAAGMGDEKFAPEVQNLDFRFSTAPLHHADLAAGMVDERAPPEVQNAVGCIAPLQHAEVAEGMVDESSLQEVQNVDFGDSNASSHDEMLAAGIEAVQFELGLLVETTAHDTHWIAPLADASNAHRWTRHAVSDGYLFDSSFAHHHGVPEDTAIPEHWPTTPEHSLAQNSSPSHWALTANSGSTRSAQTISLASLTYDDLVPIEWASSMPLAEESSMDKQNSFSRGEVLSTSPAASDQLNSFSVGEVLATSPGVSDKLNSFSLGEVLPTSPGVSDRLISFSFGEVLSTSPGVVIPHMDGPRKIAEMNSPVPGRPSVAAKSQVPQAMEVSHASLDRRQLDLAAAGAAICDMLSVSRCSEPSETESSIAGSPAQTCVGADPWLTGHKDEKTYTSKMQPKISGSAALRTAVVASTVEVPESTGNLVNMQASNPQPAVAAVKKSAAPASSWRPTLRTSLGTRDPLHRQKAKHIDLAREVRNPAEPACGSMDIPIVSSLTHEEAPKSSNSKSSNLLPRAFIEGPPSTIAHVPSSSACAVEVPAAPGSPLRVTRNLAERSWQPTTPPLHTQFGDPPPYAPNTRAEGDWQPTVRLPLPSAMATSAKGGGQGPVWRSARVAAASSATEVGQSQVTKLHPHKLHPHKESLCPSSDSQASTDDTSCWGDEGMGAQGHAAKSSQNLSPARPPGVFFPTDVDTVGSSAIQSLVPSPGAEMEGTIFTAASDIAHGSAETTLILSVLNSAPDAATTVATANGGVETATSLAFPSMPSPSAAADVPLVPEAINEAVESRPLPRGKGHGVDAIVLPRPAMPASAAVVPPDAIAEAVKVSLLPAAKGQGEDAISPRHAGLTRARLLGTATRPRLAATSSAQGCGTVAKPPPAVMETLTCLGRKQAPRHPTPAFAVPAVPTAASGATPSATIGHSKHSPHAAEAASACPPAGTVEAVVSTALPGAALSAPAGHGRHPPNTAETVLAHPPSGAGTASLAVPVVSTAPSRAAPSATVGRGRHQPQAAGAAAARPPAGAAAAAFAAPVVSTALSGAAPSATVGHGRHQSHAAGAARAAAAASAAPVVSTRVSGAAPAAPIGHGATVAGPPASFRMGCQGRLPDGRAGTRQGPAGGR